MISLSIWEIQLHNILHFSDFLALDSRFLFCSSRNYCLIDLCPSFQLTGLNGSFQLIRLWQEHWCKASGEGYEPQTNTPGFISTDFVKTIEDTAREINIFQPEKIQDSTQIIYHIGIRSFSLYRRLSIQLLSNSLPLSASMA